MGIGISGAGNLYDSAVNTRSLAYNTSDTSGAQKNSATPTAVNKNVDIERSENGARIKAEKKMGLRECNTCNNRKYQDGSNDPGVSFKAAGHISPESSASIVMAHEKEHVSNESRRAGMEGRKIVSQSVSLQTSVCPECGRVYVSGGRTTTVTKGTSENAEGKDFFAGQYKKFMSAYFGKSLDFKV